MTNQKFDTKNCPLYFGNMGKKANELNQIKSGNKADSLSFKIKTFSESLYSFINSDNKIAKFFFKENFGTRQSKGYGCFYPVNLDSTNDNIYIPNGITPLSFQISLYNLSTELDKTVTGNQQKRPLETDEYRLFKAIEIFYQFLRSGINYEVTRQPLYCKPAIFHYARFNNEQWDKKSIKQNFFYYKRNAQAIAHGSPDILCYDGTRTPTQGFDFKDLFGFSSEEGWKNTGLAVPDNYYFNAANEKIEKSFKVSFGAIPNNQITETGLSRFKSPIRFHVMDQGNRIFKIWFWIDKIPSIYLNATTTIKKGTTGTSLDLPMYNSFNSNAFIDLIFKTPLTTATSGYQNALDNMAIQPNQHNAPHYIILNEICNSIKSNLNTTR